MISNIPQRKINLEKEKIIDGCETCSSINTNINGYCEKCKKLILVISRYAESNIPIKYWFLEMSRDFVGDPSLKKRYEQTIKDLKKIYDEGSCVCLAGSHGTGKQLSLDTEIPTINGFVKLIDLKVGDKIFDENGEVCNVTQLHPIDLGPESYKIIFDDGTEIDACADHLWLTHTRDSRAAEQKVSSGRIKFTNSAPAVRATKEIYQTLKVPGKQAISNHSISCAKPLKYPKQKLPIDPYVFGVWLGDGMSMEGSIECADAGILKEIKMIGYSINICKSTIRKISKSSKYRIGDFVSLGDKYNHRIGRLRKQLKKLNVLNNKHIPNNYLNASLGQRLSLLQGLMDTDGCCLKSGQMEFCSVLPELAHQACQLILSLGMKAKIRKDKSFLNGKRCKDRYRINFTTQMPVFRLKRKLDNIVLNKTQLSRTTHRFITDIRPITPVSMRCITVDSPSNLFLITRSFIPTHNTMATTNLLKRAVERGFSALYVTMNDIIANLVSGNSFNKADIRRDLLMVDFLVIDEFDPRYMGTEAAADLFGRNMEDIFRTRMQNNLPIFMCTNSPDVAKSFSGSIGQSISSLMNYAEIVIVLGKDQRKEGK